MITKRVKLLNINFLEMDLEEKSDLIVTSPPYNLGIDYSEYDDNIIYSDFLEFSRKWLKKCFDLLKPDGRICINVPLDKNKGTHQPEYAHIVNIAEDVGFKYRNTIIWHKQNVSKRTAWGSFKSPSSPCVIAPVETIMVLYKDQWKKLEKGESDITKEEFIKWTNGLWSFPGESAKRIGHPAPFPVELPRRCMKLFSYVGDIVLDPFCGSGTTLIACMENNRKGIGIELSEEYYSLAMKRILECQKEIKLKERMKKRNRSLF